MKTLLDKSLVLVGCVCLLLAPTVPAGAAGLVWLLVAVVLSSLCQLWDGSPGATRRILAGVLAAEVAYLVAGCLSAGALPGTALAAYDLARATTLRSWSRPVAAAAGDEPTGHGGSGEPGSTSGASGILGAPGPPAWLPLLCGVPLLAAVLRRDTGPEAVVPDMVVCTLSVVLAVRTAQEEQVRDRLHALRDDLHVKMVALQHANARLLEAQEHKVQAAALSERTRIARDIHDSVGHLLTRLTLRVRALQVLHRDEPGLVEELAELGSTLDEALGSVRRSVHALSDDGEDLAVALNQLAAGCGIEVVRVDCVLPVQPPTEVSRCLVAVAREALTNAARHGRASTASVTVAELPGFWRVRITNDGAPPGHVLERQEPAPGDVDGGRSGGRWLEGAHGPTRAEEGSGAPRGLGSGLGLRSMADRVELLGGSLRIIARPRFTVLVTIPKEKEHEGADR